MSLVIIVGWFLICLPWRDETQNGNFLNSNKQINIILKKKKDYWRNKIWIEFRLLQLWHKIIFMEHPVRKKFTNYYLWDKWYESLHCVFCFSLPRFMSLSFIWASWRCLPKVLELVLYCVHNSTTLMSLNYQDSHGRASIASLHHHKVGIGFSDSGILAKFLFHNLRRYSNIFFFSL